MSFISSLKPSYLWQLNLVWCSWTTGRLSWLCRLCSLLRGDWEDFWPTWLVCSIHLSTINQNYHGFPCFKGGVQPHHPWSRESSESNFDSFLEYRANLTCVTFTSSDITEYPEGARQWWANILLHILGLTIPFYWSKCSLGNMICVYVWSCCIDSCSLNYERPILYQQDLWSLLHFRLWERLTIPLVSFTVKSVKETRFGKNAQIKHETLGFEGKYV